MPSRLELFSIGAIAIALLFGGNSLLVSIARAGGFAVAALIALGVFQILTLRRDYATGSAFARLLVSRDIIFLAAIAAAIAFVAHPARWAIGAATAAVEFGLVLEVLARVGPTAPPAISTGEKDP